ncbi:MAG: LytTR family DNA-binding domain-containing protein [Flavobacteriaceae bacterium]
MKVNLKISIAALVYFTLLIAFEAGQQYYYMTRFDLIGDQEVSLIGLIKFHVIRWFIWGILATPLSLYIIKHPTLHFTLAHVTRYFFMVFLTLLLTLLAISIFHLWYYGNSISGFSEVFFFFIYQKTALFVNAYLGLIILITLFNNMKLLDATIIELSDLKGEYQDLSKKALEDSTPLIQIRIGKKLKNVLLSEVIWVQSDDYCVRIHTKQGSYHLRKSMKSMEQELSYWGFIRIHRNSIVNKLEIDTIDFSHEPQVKLKNGRSLVMAQSRVPRIKAFLKGDSLTA